jgi:cell division protein FtsW (lipid II flippase)
MVFIFSVFCFLFGLMMFKSPFETINTTTTTISTVNNTPTEVNWLKDWLVLYFLSTQPNSFFQNVGAERYPWIFNESSSFETWNLLRSIDALKRFPRLEPFVKLQPPNSSISVLLQRFEKNLFFT